MARNTEKLSQDDLSRRAFSAAYITYCLVRSTPLLNEKLDCSLSTLVKNEDALFVGGLILRHDQIISTNSFTVKYISPVLYKIKFYLYGCTCLEYSAYEH